MTMVDLAVRVSGLERRLKILEASVARIDQRLLELDALKQAIGDLRIEVEDVQEA